MPPLKIVRIVTRMNIGGPSTHVGLLANRLNGKRFSTCLIVGQPEPGEGDRTPRVLNGPAKVIRVPTLRRGVHPARDMISFYRILRILWKEQPDLIHTHMAKAGALGRVAGWLYNRLGPGKRAACRAVLIHTFHGHVLNGYFPGWVSQGFTFVERWLARKTDCLVAVSPAIQKNLLERGIGSETQWRVVPLGLELSDLQSLAAPSYSLPLRCGLVGRLVPIKNPVLFLDAVGRVARKRSPSFLRGVIIGDGPLRPQIEKRVRDQRLGGTISLTGWREDLRRCYEELDAVCLTSWNEGTPLSLIEAMAAGRAVVASDVGGVRDLLGEVREDDARRGGGSFWICNRGILFRPGDASALAGALETLAENPALRRQLAEAGRSYALSQFSQDHLIGEISSLYHQLRQSRHGRES